MRSNQWSITNWKENLIKETSSWKPRTEPYCAQIVMMLITNGKQTSNLIYKDFWWNFEYNYQEYLEKNPAR